MRRKTGSRSDHEPFRPNTRSATFNRSRPGVGNSVAVGIGLFLPPMGVGLLMALRFANVSVGRHARTYWPYVLALLAGLMLIIAIPELSLFLPRSAGMIR
jgi:TRAP-type C4-dicarboxylate transport system permease large subunit